MVCKLLASAGRVVIITPHQQAPSDAAPLPLERAMGLVISSVLGMSAPPMFWRFVYEVQEVRIRHCSYVRTVCPSLRKAQNGICANIIGLVARTPVKGDRKQSPSSTHLCAAAVSVLCRSCCTEQSTPRDSGSCEPPTSGNRSTASLVTNNPVSTA